MSFAEKLEQFYLNEGKEELRLEKDSPHYLEYITATRLLEKYLPENAEVLDSCAGSGVYAFGLAERGFAVTAGDIVAVNVGVLEEKQRENSLLKQIYRGDARNLSLFSNGSFDAVLLMGAMYHLPDETGRSLALDESLRVLRQNGLVFCTYMNRHAVILNNASGSLENIDEILQYSLNGTEGVFYASSPEEMLELAFSRGLRVLAHAALDGMACFMTQTTGLLNKKGAERWRRYHFSSCETPSLLGYSYHNMLVLQK